MSGNVRGRKWMPRNATADPVSRTSHDAKHRYTIFTSPGVGELFFPERQNDNLSISDHNQIGKLET
jgi:hypothetical protein